MTAQSPPTISIVVPCYNGMPYLPEALDSALAQTLSAIEIIVVDDGSSDDSPQVVQDYARRHPDRGIQLIQQANAGEPAARNAGIAQAKGEWVAMLDTDDWWDPKKLEKQVEAAATAGAECVMVHTGVVHHFPDGSSEPKDLKAPARRTGWCTEALLEPASIGHPSIMVRRSALDTIGGYDPAFKQACDIDLYFRLSATGTFAFVPEHLFHYRFHPKQMSASQVDQIGYHHRAVRKFCKLHPQIAERIGSDVFENALALHVAVKLESFYWRRKMGDYRGLLAYAREQGIEHESIREWQRKARWPDWVIRLKDRVMGRRGTDQAA